MQASHTAVAYLHDAAPEFLNSADVEFCIGAKLMPAHSQIVASQSRILAKTFEDTKARPNSDSKCLFTEKDALAGLTAANLELFLVQVYSSCSQPILSATDALELFLLAERFDCPKLRVACVSYLELSTNSFLTATIDNGNAVVKWLLFAEKYHLVKLREACITFTAENYGSIKSDQRLAQLPVSTVLEVTNALYELHEMDHLLMKPKRIKKCVETGRRRTIRHDFQLG